MNVAARTEYYVEKTGLSKAAVTRYRKTPVNAWTTTAERKIGGTIRAAERLADEPDLSWPEWMKQVGHLLRVVASWVEGVFEKVVQFVERLATTAERVLKALERVLKYALQLVSVFQPLLLTA